MHVDWLLWYSNSWSYKSLQKGQRHEAVSLSGQMGFCCDQLLPQLQACRRQLLTVEQYAVHDTHLLQPPHLWARCLCQLAQLCTCSLRIWCKGEAEWTRPGKTRYQEPVCSQRWRYICAWGLHLCKPASEVMSREVDEAIDLGGTYNAIHGTFLFLIRCLVSTCVQCKLTSQSLCASSACSCPAERLASCIT